MKLTPKTISVLKNFYNINSSICFKPGDTIKTISTSKSILAQARVDVSFAKKFCIYDISRFLHTVGLLDDPEITINENTVDIVDKTSSVSYVCSRENLIVVPTAKTSIVMPEEVPCHFTFTNADIQQLFRAMAILGLPEVAIIGDGNLLTVKGIDSEGRIQDTYTLNIGTTNKVFKAIFKIDNMNKILPGDYDVKIGKVANEQGDFVNVSHFKGLLDPIEYWIVVASNSEL